MKGSYILVIFLPDKSRIYIGALGEVKFNKGFYFYIGSAMGDFGSSTLINRVKRHIQPSSVKKTHWHIDYLLNQKKSIITRIYLIPSIERLECKIAQDLIKFSDNFIKDFGSSDCNCQSHLFYSKEFKEFNFLRTSEKKNNNYSRNNYN